MFGRKKQTTSEGPYTVMYQDGLWYVLGPGAHEAHISAAAAVEDRDRRNAAARR